MIAVNPLQTDAYEYWHQASPQWKRACRTWYDRAALSLMTADPRIGLRRIGFLGTMARLARAQGPSGADLRALLPALSRRKAASVANRIAAVRFRNRAAIALAEREGLAPLAALVDDAGAGPPASLAQRDRGVLLLAFHLGAHFGVSAALRRWGIDALVLRDQPLLDADARARSLKLAIDTARSGGVVMAAVDGPGGTSSALVPCLGRQIVLRRGPLVLARLTDVAVIPIVAQWTDAGHIRIAVGQRLDLPASRGPSFELAAAAKTAAWLGDHLAAHPSDLWPYTLRNLLAAPALRPDVGLRQEARVLD